MALPSLKRLGIESVSVLSQTGAFSLEAMKSPRSDIFAMPNFGIPKQASQPFSQETETRPSINPLAIARDIQTGIARSGAAIALTLANRPELPEYPKGTIERQVKDFLFGEEAVKSLATRIAEGEQKAQQFGLGRLSLPTSAILIGGITGLDFSGMGGPKKVGEQLLKETGEEAISVILRKIGVANELTAKFTKIFSRANTPEKISEGLTLLSKESEALRTVSKAGEEVLPLTTKLPKEGLKVLLPKQELRPSHIFPQLGAKGSLPPSISLQPIKSIGQEISESIDWLVKTIKTAARPGREELAKLQSKELSKRAGAVAGIFERGEGLSGYYKALGKLKGPLVEGEKKIFQVEARATEDISKLMRAAQLNPKLDIFERLNTQTALIKVLNGVIPTNSELRLLEDTFGPKLVDAILEQRTAGQKLLAGFQEAINLPRTIMSSFDLSAPFRQGLMLLSHPTAFGKNFTQMFKMFGSEKAFKATMETIAKMPEYELMKSGKLAITDVGRFIGTREESFAASWAEKIPVVKYGVKASSRAYTGFLNKMRADVFSDIIRGARIAGKDVSKNSQLVKNVASFVNAASGRGGLGAIERAAPFLNGLFFSPRLMASRLYFLNPVNYIKSDPIIRKEMLKSVFTVFGSGMVVLGLADAAGLKIGKEPRSSDFGKIVIGKTRIDIWGGFQQYVRMIAQLITGEYVSSVTSKKITLGEGYKPLTRFDILQRQIESKEAPLLSFVTALLKQKDFRGKPISVPEEVGKRFVPMVLGDIYQLAKENPNLLPVELLGMFGFGIQTYESRPAAGTGKGIPGLPKSPLKMKSDTFAPLKGIGF